MMTDCGLSQNVQQFNEGGDEFFDPIPVNVLTLLSLESLPLTFIYDYVILIYLM